MQASTGGQRFADKALSLRADNTLRYRPSDGLLPPTAPWAVGDVCRAPSLVDGSLVPAVIEHLENGNEPGQLAARVRFLQYDDVPIIETVTTDMLEPLDDVDFLVAAQRQQRAQGNGGMIGFGSSPAGIAGLQGSLTQTERAIFEDCRNSVDALSILLEQDGALCTVGIDVGNESACW